ncbi:MAG: hypothetical protein QOJ62_2341, partial [Actinomycetota bacterium]|nr:hypothetical protein [Actinomycetota bacterium]
MRTPTPTPTPARGTGTGPADWPSVPGACGSTAYLPQLTLAEHYGAVHGTVLVGGAALQKIVVGQPSATPVPGGPVRPSSGVGSLVAGPDAAYATIERCASGGPQEIGALYRIEAGVAHALAVPAHPSSPDGYQDFFGGAHHAWAVWYPAQITPSGGGVPFNP